EVTVHRIDAQAAAGTDTAVDPGFAADGIDEVLTRHIQRRTDAWAVTELSGTVLYHAADAGRAWTVRLVPGQLPQTARENVAEPEASVVGLADAVYRAAWGRPSRAVISGDTDLIEATRAG
ncbi:MAG: mycothiol maleylpyruvate isomerase, partial [Pseudonocardiaceae bacterium]